MIISRVGSLIVEPLYKKIKLIKYSDYNTYLQAREMDTKGEINNLLEMSNMYRTALSGCFILGAVKVYMVIIAKYKILANVTPILLVVSLIFLFSFSYMKQVKYIGKKVEFLTNK